MAGGTCFGRGLRRFKTPIVGRSAQPPFCLAASGRGKKKKKKRKRQESSSSSADVDPRLQRLSSSSSFTSRFRIAVTFFQKH